MIPGLPVVFVTMADIRAEPAVVNSFVSNIIEARHLVLTQMIHLNDL